MSMAAPHTPTHWTVDMVHALPDDGRRYEVIDGELFVTPSPSFDHQGAVVCFVGLLRAYLATHRVGYVRTAPGDVEFGSRTLVQPDVFVVPRTEGQRPKSWKAAGRPMLAIEVVSPSSAHADRIRKRALYQGQGVPEFWAEVVEG